MGGAGLRRASKSGSVLVPPHEGVRATHCAMPSRARPREAMRGSSVHAGRSRGGATTLR